MEARPAALRLLTLSSGQSCFVFVPEEVVCGIEPRGTVPESKQIEASQKSPTTTTETAADPVPELVEEKDSMGQAFSGSVPAEDGSAPSPHPRSPAGSPVLQALSLAHSHRLQAAKVVIKDARDDEASSSMKSCLKAEASSHVLTCPVCRGGGETEPGEDAPPPPEGGSGELDTSIDASPQPSPTLTSTPSILSSQKSKGKKKKGGKKPSSGKGTSGTAAGVSTTTEDSPHRIRWGWIQVREMRRGVGASGGIPEGNNDWALGLSDQIVIRDPETGDMIDVHREDDWGVPVDNGLLDPTSLGWGASLEVIEPGDGGEGGGVHVPTRHGSPRLGGQSGHGGSRRYQGGKHHGHHPSSPRGGGSPRSTPLQTPLDTPSLEELDALEPLTPAALGSGEATASRSSGSSSISLRPAVRRRRSSSVGVVTLTTIDAFEEWKRGDIEARTSMLTKKERGIATGETRQNSHKKDRAGGGNPLFRPLSSRERAALITRDVGPTTSSNLLARNEWVAAQLNAIEASREVQHCRCRVLTPEKVKPWAIRRLQQELEVRGLPIPGTGSRAEMVEALVAWSSRLKTCHPVNNRGDLFGPPLSVTCAIPPTGPVGVTAFSNEEKEEETDPLLRAALLVGRVVIDAATAHQRATVLEMETDHDHHAFFHTTTSPSGTHHSRESGSFEAAALASIGARSSESASSTPAPPLPHGVQGDPVCPCTLEGVGCNDNVCECFDNDCCNRWLTDITSYTYDSASIKEIRGAIIGRSSTDEGSLFLDEEDLFAIRKGIAAGWISAQEAQRREEEARATAAAAAAVASASETPKDVVNVEEVEAVGDVPAVDGEGDAPDHDDEGAPIEDNGDDEAGVVGEAVGDADGPPSSHFPSMDEADFVDAAGTSSHDEGNEQESGHSTRNERGRGRGRGGATRGRGGRRGGAAGGVATPHGDGASGINDSPNRQVRGKDGEFSPRGGRGRGGGGRPPLSPRVDGPPSSPPTKHKERPVKNRPDASAPGGGPDDAQGADITISPSRAGVSGGGGRGRGRGRGGGSGPTRPTDPPLSVEVGSIDDWLQCSASRGGRGGRGGGGGRGGRGGGPRPVSDPSHPA